MVIAYVAMGLQYAVLFACVAAAKVWPKMEPWTSSFHWTEKMTMKNPENNPTFNYAQLGSFQDAWQVLEETSNNTYFLMFRTRAPTYYKCITATADIKDKTNKTASYTIASYNPFASKYEKTIQVRALSQTDYPLENVIRANLKGTLPSATPVPPGSYTYAEYDNSTCYSKSYPFPDGDDAAKPQLRTLDYDDFTVDVLDDLFPFPEYHQYVDMYVVYNEPQCYILRSPAAMGGCDLWLRKNELKSIVDGLNDEIIKKEKELMEKYKEEVGIFENCTAQDYQTELVRDYVGDDIERWFQDIVWKRVSLDCVLAYMITCGAPVFRVYNPLICNASLKNQRVSIH